MYLLLVDQEFISTIGFQGITGHLGDNADVVMCYSPNTLLNIAEKLLPNKIIIDIDLVNDDLVEYFRTLRSLCLETLILVLINQNDYEKMRIAIERGSVDDYLVKPIIKNDLIARIHRDPKDQIWGLEDYIELPDDEKEEVFRLPIDSLEIAETVLDTPGDEHFSEINNPDIITEDNFEFLWPEEDNYAAERESSFKQVFGGSPSHEYQEEPVDGYSELFEDILASEDEVNIKWDLPANEYVENNRKTDPALVRPAEEFLSEFEPFAIPETRPGSDELKAGSRVKRRQSTGSFINRLISTIGNLILVLLLAVMALVSIFLIVSRVSESVPQVAGYQFYIINSATMSPEISDGSLALGRETDPARIAAGDIITFYSQDEPGSITAGRVTEVSRENGLNILTTQESISASDPRQVSADDVIGRVIGSVPYIGQLIDYAQTLEGLILLIFVPGFLIIVFQMSKIIKYFIRNKSTVH